MPSFVPHFTMRLRSSSGPNRNGVKVRSGADAGIGDSIAKAAW
jgi:hypothetical protein